MENIAPPDLGKLLDEPGKRRWFRRPLVWAVTIGLVLLAVAFGYWQLRRSANAAPRYSTQVVARGDLTLTVTANGTIQPTRSINIGSELSGTVLAVNVDVNDKVHKGEVLVVLDTAKLKDQVLRSAACRRLRASRAARSPRKASSIRVLRYSSAPRRMRRARALASSMRVRRCPPTRSICRKHPLPRRRTA